MSNDDVIISPDTLRENRVPPNQRVVKKWPVMHEGPVRDIGESDWCLRIFGLVGREKRLDFGDFTALQRVKVYSDVHCVTGWTRLGVNWEGVPASAIREVVDIAPVAKFVMVHCAGDYTTNLSLDDFFAEDVLFVLSREGEPMESQFGHPVRLVVPRLYYWKSAKWVNGLEFMAADRLGFWETRGYHHRGDPWKEERYSHR